MIKMKYKVLLNKEFTDALSALKSITGIKSASVLLSAAKIVRCIHEHGQDYNEARDKIVRDLEAGPGIVLPDEKQQELNKRISDLIETEFEIPFQKLSVKDLPHNTLSPGNIAALELLLIIPD